MTIRQRLVTGLVLSFSVGLCLLGQYYLSDKPDYKLDAAIFYGVGLALFGWALYRLGALTTPTPRPTDTPFEPITWRWPWLVLSILFAAAAYYNFADNTFTRAGVIAWFWAIAFFLIALWPNFKFEIFPWPAGASQDGLACRPGQANLKFKITWRTLALAFIIALAAFFRLYQLDQIPPDMTSDHAEKLLDIYDLAKGERPIYFERNTGREPFQFYWAFTVMRVFNTGISFFGLKLGNALIGIITLYGIYLLGRELAGQDVGLLAAFFAAVMQWAQSITRAALRFPYATVGVAFALWALLRALRTGRRADYLMAGLVFGAGFHGYTAYRIMPVVFIALIALKLIFERPRSRPAWVQFVFNLVVFICITLIVFLPLARYWHDQPDMFWYRSATRVQGDGSQNAWRTLGNNTLRALGMFNVVGDTVWVNTIPNKPTLDEVGGAFLILGVMAAIYRVFKKRDFPLLMAIVAGVLLLFPSILCLAFPNENPSVVRAAGAIPVASVLVGLGLYAVTRAVWRVGGARRGAWLAVSLLALLLAATTRINYQRYFVEYLRSYQLSSENSAEIAQTMCGFIASGGYLQHIVIRAWPHWVDTRTLALIFGEPGWQDTNVVIENLALLKRLRDDPAPQMYILHVEDTDGLSALRAIFPQGYAVHHVSPIPGHDFLLFFVPARYGSEAGHDNVSPIPIPNTQYPTPDQPME